MNAPGTDKATPNPRALPPSAVKDVEESRQQRLQRQQARFRDRGGIFVPTNRNTLVDILLGRKEVSPKKSRRSRSRSQSCSPQKPPASPTSGKGKRISLDSSTAITTGRISVGLSGPRRSPRKKSTKASTTSKESAAKTRKAAGRKSKLEEPPKPSVPNNPKARSGETTVYESEEDIPPAKPSKKGSRKAKDPNPPSLTTKKQGATKSSNKGGRSTRDKGQASEPSTSRLPSETLDDSPPRSVPKTRTRRPPKSNSKVTKSSKGKARDNDEEPAPSKASPKPRKRKLSIVQEEEEELEAEPFVEEEEPPPPPVERPKKKLKPAPNVSALATTEPQKSAAQSVNPRIKGKAPAKKRKAAETEEPEVSDVGPPKSRRKRPAAPHADDVEPSKKKAKTALPLQEVDMVPDKPQATTKEARSKSKKPPSRSRSSKPGTRPSRKQKENTPVSDLPDVKAAADNQSRSKPPGIKGPRKSVMIRIKEPLPPIEDNDPDPIDFLS